MRVEPARLEEITKTIAAKTAKRIIDARRQVYDEGFLDNQRQDPAERLRFFMDVTLQEEVMMLTSEGYLELLVKGMVPPPAPIVYHVVDIQGQKLLGPVADVMAAQQYAEQVGGQVAIESPSWWAATLPPYSPLWTKGYIDGPAKWLMDDFRRLYGMYAMRSEVLNGPVR